MLPSDRALSPTTSNDPSSDRQADLESRSVQAATLVALAQSRAVCTQAIHESQCNISPDVLVSNVTAERVGDPQAGSQTDLLQIKVKATNPSEAIRLANAVSISFSQIYDSVSHKEAANNRRFLEDQLQGARTRLETCKKNLREFRSQKGIASIVAQEEAVVGAVSSLRSERDTVASQLAEVTGRLGVMSGQLARIGKIKRIVEKTSEGSTAALLKTQITDMEKQLSLLRSRYTSKHPKVINLQATLARAREQLSGISTGMVSKETLTANPAYEATFNEKLKFEAERAALAARVTAIDKAVAGREAELSTYTGADVELDGCALDFKTAQDTYSSILARLNQAKMSESLTSETGAIQVLEPAISARGPMRKGPNPVQVWIASVLFGIALGVVFAVKLDHSEKERLTAETAAKAIGLSVHGVIPELAGNPDIIGMATVTLALPQSEQAEMFRFLAARLLIEADQLGIKTLMPVALSAQQGGTTVACNLAVSFAQAGKAVTLVDADFRNPKIHEIFGIANDFGVTNCGTPECAPLQTLVSNLSVIPSGPLPRNPWELLKSEKFIHFIQGLKDENDFVILNVPNATTFADATVVSGTVDGIVVVMGADKEPQANEKQIVDLLRKNQVTFMGAVLNKATCKHVGCYQCYDYNDLQQSTPNFIEERSHSKDIQSTWRLEK